VLNRVHCFLVSLLLSTTGAAQTFEKVLLPVHQNVPQPGAYGAAFATQLTILNESVSAIEIGGLNPLCATLCVPMDPPKLRPGVTYVNPPLQSGAAWSENIAGVFLYLPVDHLRDVSINLRVQDLSRQSETAGTAVRVVPESVALTGINSLQPIPVAARFRQALRVYSFSAIPGRRVRVRFFRINQSTRTPVANPNAQPDEFLHEVELTYRIAVSGGGAFDYPGYAEIQNLQSLPELAGSESIRIELVPDDVSVRYWAIASVTHNDTQHITVIEPN
jgi:hypothetical protein